MEARNSSYREPKVVVVLQMKSCGLLRDDVEVLDGIFALCKEAVLVT